MSVAVTMKSPWWVKRFSRLLLLAMLIGGILYLPFDYFYPRYRLGLNGNASLPGWIYLVYVGDKSGLQREEIVALYPPRNPYFPSRYVFLKKIMGIPGDVITETDRVFSVNNRYAGFAKTHTSAGKPLEVGPTGILPKGRYFVWTPHEDSYDSRYQDIGWISDDRIIGRAVCLL